MALPRLLLRYGFGFLFLLLVVGCSGGSTYSVDTGDLAERYLPTTRTVDHHPDSLRSFTITESDDQMKVELEDSYEALHRKWSCTFQNLGTGRNERTRTYATLWSKELSLASLEADAGFSSLTKDRARQLLTEQKQEYQNSLQIDLYWFESEGNSLVAGPGSRVVLEIDGEKYRPDRETHGPLRETFLLQGDGRALYRRNTFYFPRTVDDTNILNDAERVVMTINRSGLRVRFTWEWKGEEASARIHRRPGSTEPAGLGPLARRAHRSPR